MMSRLPVPADSHYDVCEWIAADAISEILQK
jgi:hypothetical protein